MAPVCSLGLTNKRVIMAVMYATDPELAVSAPFPLPYPSLYSLIVHGL